MSLAAVALILAALSIAWALVVDGPAQILALIPGMLAASIVFELWLARRARLLVPLGLALLAVALLPSLALAADVSVGALVRDLRETIITIAGVVVSGIVGLISWSVWRLTGVKIDEGMRKALQSAMEHGVHAAVDAVEGAAANVRVPALDNEVVQIALRYVRLYAPDAVRHFGLSDARLAELLRAQIGKIVPAIPSA